MSSQKERGEAGWFDLPRLRPRCPNESGLKTKTALPQSVQPREINPELRRRTNFEREAIGFPEKEQGRGKILDLASKPP